MTRTLNAPVGRRLAAIGLAMTGSTIGMVVAMPAAPAQADAAACSLSYSCLWGNRNYSGNPWWEKKTLGRYNTGWLDNDETSSVWNRLNTASLLLYNHTNQDSSGGVVCVPRMYASRDLNEESPEFDDRVSSMWLRSGYCSTDYSSISVIGSKKTSP